MNNDIPLPSYLAKKDFAGYKMPKHLKLLERELWKIATGKNKRLIVSMPPRHGKAMKNDTPVLTTKGWVNHGDLMVNDYVYGMDGLPKRILATQECYINECQMITFDTGEQLICANEHEWVLQCDRDKRINGKRIGRQEEILETANIFNGYHRRVPAIQLPSKFHTEKYRFIHKIEPVGKHLVKCIQVEGGIYLVGKGLIPTHNSEMISKYFPAWFLMHFPDKRIVLASYSAALAEGYGRMDRDLIDEYGKSYGVYLNNSSRSKTEFSLDKRHGYMLAKGVNGTINGKGAHVFIIDDPVKNSEFATSSSQNEKTWNWFQSTAFTRLAPDGAVIIVMTRWDKKDLVGRLIEHSENNDSEPWTIINLPAIAEDNDILGREAGEALWPEQYDLKALNEIKSLLGNYWFSALYQGNPIPSEGLLFEKQYLNTYTELPDNLRGVIYCDPNLSLKGKGDTTAIFKTYYCMSDRCYYVDDITCRSFSNPNLLIDSIYDMRGRDIRYIGQDGNVGQESTWSNFFDEYCRRNDIVRIPIKFCRYNTDLIAKNTQMLWSSNRIKVNEKLLKTKDGREALDQIYSFAGKKHTKGKDDAPDALICSIEFINEMFGVASNTQILKALYNIDLNRA